MSYQLSETEKQQAAELSKIDRKMKKLQYDINYAGDSPAQNSPFDMAGSSQFDEMRDSECTYYKHCTLPNCLNCKRLK